MGVGSVANRSVLGGRNAVTSSRVLRQVWEDHPHYRYRGCAEDQVERGRAAGDVSLSLDAWHGDDRDGSEPPRVREARQAAAVEVCLNCPVMVQCDAYANSVVVEDGRARLAEPAGVWGGRTGLERHRAFIRRRHEVAVPAPRRLVLTGQREAVLLALAVHWEPGAVASAAGVDVRTANWQRRRLVTMLALPQAVSRGELLAAAVAQGLLDADVVVADDGGVPAVPPPAAPSRTGAGASSVPGGGGMATRSVPGGGGTADRSVPPIEAPAVLRGRIRRPGRRRVVVHPGQLSLDDVLAPVLKFPTCSEPMEAAV
ncbi:WhiB family transcriptional regulator [Streptomyces sp. AD55]|uniref:WhiB family transcriptional regulator n=1 Tax=Streptomyces sp. AD55 TaxID=3242895 RepID=UPI0035272346